MELRELRYFCVLGETLHFGRAADRLFISQPSLSYAIKQLEGELGTALFVRGRHRVSLTPAGQELLASANEVLRAVEKLNETATRYRKALAGRLRVGFVANLVMLDGPARVFASFRERYPDVELALSSVSLSDMDAGVLQGDLDAAILLLPVGRPEIATLPLAELPRVALLSRRHPMSSRSEVTFHDLSDMPVISMSSSVPQERRHFWAADDWRDGPPAGMGPSVRTLEELLLEVAANRAIAFGPEMVMNAYPRDDVASVRVKNLGTVTLALVWRPENRNPALQALLELARDVVAQGSPIESGSIPG
jgi:DNA-binding transcriptional LysR family regulator